MLKSFKLIATTLMSLSMGMAAFAQEQERFKDVLLDGKPAKLNVVTGEITLVTLEEKSVEGILDTVTVRPILVSDTSIITASNKSEVENESTSDFYIVKDGETLLDVSKKYKVTLAQLMQANNLETTLINAGQKLRIKNFDTETKPILSTDTYSGKDEFNIHVVKKGNTLFGLAKRFNLSVQELKSLNNLDSNIIKIGQKLHVNNFETSDTSEKLLVYIVKKGDNLYRIAKEHRTTVKSIKELNGLNSNHLQIGQKLRLK